MAFFKPKPDKPSLTMLLGDSFWRMDEVEDERRLLNRRDHDGADAPAAGREPVER